MLVAPDKLSQFSAATNNMKDSQVIETYAH